MIIDNNFDPVKSRIMVKVQSGSTVTVADGVQTFEEVSDGTASFDRLAPGRWRVWASNGVDSTPEKVVDLGRHDIQLVELAYPIQTVPSQSGNLTYNGSAQSPTWAGYDANQLILGGTTSATDAGTHTATFTPKPGYQWPDGSSGAKAVSWTIGRAVIASAPSQSGSLTYNGGAQSPAWTGYDSAKMTIGGTTSEVNAGTYWASFTPTSNHCWAGGGTDAEWCWWAIGKAAGSLAVEPANMPFTSIGVTWNLWFSRFGDGAVSIVSSNPSVAKVGSVVWDDASVGAGHVAVTSVDNGSATITVKVAEGTNHTAPGNKTCAVSVDAKFRFTYTGQYEFTGDPAGNWKLKFLTNGIFRVQSFGPTGNKIDLFLVGGGGGGDGGYFRNSGGGGYANTHKAITVELDKDYTITIGSGGATSADGGTTSAFAKSAFGGKRGRSGSTSNGGNGGSGGAGYLGKGGTDGADGTYSTADGNNGKGGTGQHDTTREFGESNGKLYSSGGTDSDGTVTNNSGNGGGGHYPTGYPGSSGVAVIRNAR